MRGGAKKKKKRMESLRLRKTGVKDKHLYGGGLFPPAGELCLLLVSPLSRQNKTKEKKKKALPSLSCSKPNMQPGHMEGG